MHPSRLYYPMSHFWKSTRRWLPGVLISLVAIAVILRFIDLKHFIESMRLANYWLLLAVLPCTVVWLAVRGMVWRTLLRKKATYRDTFLTICEGYLLNNFLPFRLGEVGRAFLLGRKSKLDFMEVLSTVVIERILDLAIAALILMSTVPFVVGAAGAGKIALIIGSAVVSGLIVLFLFARNRDRVINFFERVSDRWPGLQKQGGNYLSALLSGLSILNNGWLFLRVMVWMLLNWVVSFFQFHLLILSFFPKATPLWPLFGLGVVSFGNAIPSLPGAVGTFEGSLGGAIMLLGGDQSTALAAAVTAHLFNYISTGIIGLYALSSEGETLMGVYRQLKEKQASMPGSKTTESVPSSGPGVDLSAADDLSRDEKEKKELP